MRPILFIFITINCINCNSDIPDLSSHKSWKILRHDLCGHSSSFRIIGGKLASLGAYPWIARIGYRKVTNGDITFKCGGVVINNKTVLTAAHCVHKFPQNQTGAVVRLGEHNIETDPDCLDETCADPVQDYKPSEIIIHKSYNKPFLKNDIAMIRFEKEINFTSYVRPICLMHGSLLKKNYTGSICEIAGWGVFDTKNYSKISNALLTLKIPLIGNKKCNEAYYKHTDIDETQFCGGGISGQDSCGGDSGGPVMMVEDSIDSPRYYLMGIISFGMKRCGLRAIPGVYTRISAFISWILDNLEISTTRFKRII